MNLSPYVEILSDILYMNCRNQCYENHNRTLAAMFIEHRVNRNPEFIIDLDWPSVYFSNCKCAFTFTEEEKNTWEGIIRFGGLQLLGEYIVQTKWN